MMVCLCHTFYFHFLISVVTTSKFSPVLVSSESSWNTYCILNAIFARIIFFPANGLTSLLCFSDGYNSHLIWWWWGGGWRRKSPGTGVGRWEICWNTAGRRTLHGRWCQIAEIHLGVWKWLSSLTQARFDLEETRTQIRDFYLQQLRQTLREVRQPVRIHLPTNEPDWAAM